MSSLLVYGSQSPAARTVLLYGNCQIPFLAKFLGGIPGLNDAYRFVCQTNHGLPGEDVRLVLDDVGSDVALLFEQIDERAHVPVREAMRARLACPKIVFPTYWLASMWPIDCTETRIRPEPRFPWGRYPLGDAIGLQVAELGLKGDAAFAAYMDRSARHMPNIDVRFERDLQRMRRYDRESDVPITDLVLANFRQRHWFWTWGHTAVEPLVELAQLLWRAARPVLGGTDEEARRGIAAAASGVAGIGEIQLPIHPMVIEALGLEFCNDETRYRWYDQSWTFREYITRYIEYDTSW